VFAVPKKETSSSLLLAPKLKSVRSDDETPKVHGLAALLSLVDGDIFCFSRDRVSWDSRSTASTWSKKTECLSPPKGFDALAFASIETLFCFSAISFDPPKTLSFFQALSTTATRESTEPKAFGSVRGFCKKTCG
jgi:hypothetical protein